MREYFSSLLTLRFQKKTLFPRKLALTVISLFVTAVFLLPVSQAGAATPATAVVPPSAVETDAEFALPKCQVQCCHDYGCKEMDSDLDCKAMIQARLLCPSSDHKVTCGEKVCYCRK